jgi:hypothetical protein
MLYIRTLAVILILFAGGIVGVTAELSTEHSVDIADSMNIPAQTVETEWGEATITEVGKEESGESLDVSTNAPENESYAIRIVDSEERNLETEFVDSGGDTETSFLLNRYDPGTYVVALTQDGGDTAVEVEPFIVKGYAVDQSVNDVTKGNSITADIQLTAVSDDPADPQVVNMTLFGNGVTRSAEATKTDENSYQANFSTDELSTGSYDVYTGVETTGDIYGYNELIGLSDSVSVTVEDSETETPTSTPAPEDPTETDNVGDDSIEGSETASPAVEQESTINTQTSPSPVTTQLNATESTQTKTQRQTQTSEPTAVETAPQTEPQPQSTPSNTESASVTTSSEMPIFPSAGIIILSGALIGILHRFRHSE